MEYPETGSNFDIVGGPPPSTKEGDSNSHSNGNDDATAASMAAHAAAFANVEANGAPCGVWVHGYSFWDRTQINPKDIVLRTPDGACVCEITTEETSLTATDPTFGPWPRVFPRNIFIRYKCNRPFYEVAKSVAEVWRQAMELLQVQLSQCFVHAHSCGGLIVMALYKNSHFLAMPAAVFLYDVPWCGLHPELQALSKHAMQFPEFVSDFLADHAAQTGVVAGVGAGLGFLRKGKYAMAMGAGLVSAASLLFKARLSSAGRLLGRRMGAFLTNQYRDAEPFIRMVSDPDEKEELKKLRQQVLLLSKHIPVHVFIWRHTEAPDMSSSSLVSEKSKSAAKHHTKGAAAKAKDALMRWRERLHRGWKRQHPVPAMLSPSSKGGSKPSPPATEDGGEETEPTLLSPSEKKGNKPSPPATEELGDVEAPPPAPIANDEGSDSELQADAPPKESREPPEQSHGMKHSAKTKVKHMWNKMKGMKLPWKGKSKHEGTAHGGAEESEPATEAPPPTSVHPVKTKEETKEGPVKEEPSQVTAGTAAEEGVVAAPDVTKPQPQPAAEAEASTTADGSPRKAVRSSSHKKELCFRGFPVAEAKQWSIANAAARIRAQTRAHVMHTSGDGEGINHSVTPAAWLYAWRDSAMTATDGSQGSNQAAGIARTVSPPSLKAKDETRQAEPVHAAAMDESVPSHHSHTSVYGLFLHHWRGEELVDPRKEKARNVAEEAILESASKGEPSAEDLEALRNIEGKEEGEKEEDDASMDVEVEASQATATFTETSGMEPQGSEGGSGMRRPRTLSQDLSPLALDRSETASSEGSPAGLPLDNDAGIAQHGGGGGEGSSVEEEMGVERGKEEEDGVPPSTAEESLTTYAVEVEYDDTGNTEYEGNATDASPMPTDTPQQATASNETVSRGSVRKGILNVAALSSFLTHVRGHTAMFSKRTNENKRMIAVVRGLIEEIVMWNLPAPTLARSPDPEYKEAEAAVADETSSDDAKEGEEKDVAYQGQGTPQGAKPSALKLRMDAGGDVKGAAPPSGISPSPGSPGSLRMVDVVYEGMEDGNDFDSDIKEDDMDEGQEAFYPT